MTDEERIELFKKFEITEADIRFIVEELRYNFTEKEIDYLSDNLVYINTVVLNQLIEYEEQTYLIDIMDETINAELPKSVGIVRRKYPDIFECYLDSLDEDETAEKLLSDADLCDKVIERYEDYMEHACHSDAMHNAIQEVVV